MNESTEKKYKNTGKEAKEDKKDKENKGTVKQKDIKLGEIQLREDSVLLIKKTNYKGHDRVDFRVWKNSPTYKGPTKQGFVVSMDKIDEFVKIVEGMKKKLQPKKKLQAKKII